MLPAVLWKCCYTELPDGGWTQDHVLWASMKSVLTWAGKLFLLHLPGFLFVGSEVWGGGKGDGMMDDLSIRFHYRQERRNTGGVYTLSWGGASRKLNAVAAKNVQDNTPCKLHSWFLFNKMSPSHLARKCCLLRIQLRY